MKNSSKRLMKGLLAVMLICSSFWLPVETKAADGTTQADSQTVTKIQAEDAQLSLPSGSDMSSAFVFEQEPASDEGGHIKTSVLGASVTLEFEGTGIRFYTKKGNGAGQLSVSVDGEEPQTVDEYIDSTTAQFKVKVYEDLELSADNEAHTIVLTTLDGDRTNFNFDYFEVIADQEEEPDPDLEETVTTVQAEDDEYVTLDPALGSSMSDSFVKEAEPNSNGGAHIKTSVIGATLTLRFEGTGVRFYTKKGNGAGKLSVTLDGEDLGEIDEYIDSTSAQFQEMVFAREGISVNNEEHTLVLTTVDGERTNFNFDCFDIISLEKKDTYIPSPGNTTYYLDSTAAVGGDGLSEGSAFDSLDDINQIEFAPGDRILIKAGSSFLGQLYPKGSGSAEAPVIIDMYGEGEKPLIDGNGRYSDAPSVHDDGPFGEAGSAVYLCNQQYWEINNLRVRNWSDDNQDKERSGIRVEAYGGGTYHHIYIRNCEISDIRGYNGQDSIWDVVPENGGTTFYGARTTHRTGGINIVSYTKRDTSGGLGTAGAILDDQPTIFDDVLIEDNTIENCHANGITTHNVRGELDDKAYRHTHVVIRGNEIRNVQRAGIVPLYTSGALVEHNLVDTFQQTYAGYGCGIWCDRADGMLFQYNEVCNGRNTMDGMAFNLDDMTENGIIQYNYTHNNVGGGIMLHVRTNSYNRNNIVRYNLSVNDTQGYAAHQAIVVCVGEDANTKIENAKVYNNTFINNNVVHPVYQGDEILFENNIFYLPNEGMSARNDAYVIGANTTFRNNVFAGSHSASEPSGNGNVSVSESPVAGTFYGSESLDEALDMAKLRHGSAALGIGDDTLITQDGVETDVYGNPAGGEQVNAGIYNGESVDPLPDAGDPGTNPDLDEEPDEDEYRVEYVEAESESVEKSPGYVLVEGSGSQGHANSHIYYSNTGTWVEYTFIGKAISVYSKTGPGAGTIDILLDGEQVGVDDQYTAAQTFNKRAYTKVFEEEGTHTIRLENNGLKNPSATGNSFNLDCFKIFHEKEDNADLRSIRYQTGNGEAMTIEGFDPTITEYDVTLPAGTYGEIRLIAEAESTLADIQADPVTIENGKAEGVITVTAENGTEKTYRIHFTVESSSGSIASDAAIDALRNMVDKAVAFGSEDEALNAAIEVAQAVLAKEEPTSAEVVTALLDLSEAIQALNTSESIDALRADVQATIDFIKEHILNNVEGLRPGKVDALEAAVEAAQKLVDDPDASADDLKAANRAMTKAAQELWEIVSKAELNALIEAANGYLDGNYTEESLAALQAAIEAAQAVAVNDDATTTEVAEAITNLANAIAGLETIQLDTSALEHEIELVSEMIANIGNYVPSSVEGLQEKLDDAQNVLENAATQAEIDEATKTLREARLNARTKADTSALEELIAYINSLDLRAYTTESAQALIQELARAENLTNDPEITQEEVDDMVKDLQASVDELVEINNSTNAEESTNTAAAMQTGLFAGLLAASAGFMLMMRRHRQYK